MSQRAVAFVDILGFKNLVELAERNSNAHQFVVSMIKDIRRDLNISPNFPETLEPSSYTDAHIKSVHFSDSIIITAAPTLAGIGMLFSFVSTLQLKLLKNQVLCRGAISAGYAYHQESIVFGTAVNEAYKLESKVAKHPRIILGESLISLANELSKKENGYNVLDTSIIRRDSDGSLFIHYLNQQWNECIGLFMRRKHKIDEDESCDFINSEMRRMSDDIKNFCMSFEDTSDIFLKWQWVKTYWNNTFDGFTDKFLI